MNFIRSKLRVTRFLSLSLSLVQARSTRTRETRLHRITSGQRCVISLGGRKPKIAPVRIWYTGRSNGPSLKVVEGGGGERRLNREGRLRKPNCRRNDRRIKGGGGEISLRVTDGQQWKPVFWAKTKESYTRGRET